MKIEDLLGLIEDLLGLILAPSVVITSNTTELWLITNKKSRKYYNWKQSNDKYENVSYCISIDKIYEKHIFLVIIK